MTQPVHDKARVIYASAKRSGVDWLEMLDAYGLIVTEAQIQRIRVETLRALKQSFDQWLPHEYTRRLRDTDTFTAHDMHRAIDGYLTEYLAHVVQYEQLP